jgi:cytochrome c oxidase cbb3-type subunit 1
MMENENNGLVNYALVKFHIFFAVTYLVIVMLMGLIYSLQLLQWNPLPEWFWLSPGRLRMIHTNGAVYGFITNGFLAGLYWAVPRLCGYKVFNEKIVGWFLAIALQVAVLGTVVMIMFLGMAQAIEWGSCSWVWRKPSNGVKPLHCLIPLSPPGWWSWRSSLSRRFSRPEGTDPYMPPTGI